MTKLNDQNTFMETNDEVAITGNDFICGLACVVLCGVGGFWATASSMVASYV